MSTARDSKSEKILQVMTEVDDAAVHSRKRLKGMFLEKDKLQMSSYIKDLEKTIALNKSIIADLLSSQTPDVATYKKTIDKLNQENSAMQTQVKKMIKQRDDSQARLLICEQIVEELKGREKDIEQQHLEKTQDMLDQLNRKEYVLQCYERRYHKAVALLRKYAERDGEIRLLLKDIGSYDTDQKCITNVLEENEVLVTEVKSAREKVAQLEYKFTELAHEVHTKAHGLKNLPIREEPDKRKLSKKNYGAFPGTARKELHGVAAETKALSDMIAQLQVDKELIGQSIKKLREENEGLTKLNSELSQKLNEALDEIRVLKGKKRRQRVMSVFNGDPKENIRTLKSQKRKELIIGMGGSFDQMSSIDEDFKDGFFSFEHNDNGDEYQD